MTLRLKRNGTDTTRTDQSRYSDSKIRKEGNSHKKAQETQKPFCDFLRLFAAIHCTRSWPESLRHDPEPPREYDETLRDEERNSRDSIAGPVQCGFARGRVRPPPVSERKMCGHR